MEKEYINNENLSKQIGASELGTIALGVVNCEEKFVLPADSDSGLFDYQEKKDIETLLSLFEEE